MLSANCSSMHLIICLVPFRIDPKSAVFRFEEVWPGTRCVHSKAIDQCGQRYIIYSLSLLCDITVFMLMAK